jgi:SSS family solute:Na+ symporter
MGIDNILAISVPLVLAFAVEPTLWMRLVSARSTKDARKGSLLAVLIYIPVCIGTLLAGLAAFVLFPNWDPSQSDNMVAVEMSQKLFSPFVTSIIFVGIIAALISSFNAFMTAANMNLSYDFIPAIYKQIKKRDFPEDKYRTLSRWGMVVVAFVSTFVALWLPTLVKILEFSGSLIASAIFLPVMGLFFSKKITRFGAILSSAVGGITQLVLFIVDAPLGINPFFISFPLAFIALIIGTVVSKKKPTKDQLAPFFEVNESK